MKNENPYQSPQSRLHHNQKRKFHLLLKIGLGMEAAFVGLWALNFCITVFSMTKTFNDMAGKVSADKINSDVAQTFSITAWINGIGAIIGVLGLVFIISAVLVKIFSKNR